MSACRIKTNRAIHSIILEDGKELVDPIEINTAFQKYYEDLYKSEYPGSSQKENEFLDLLQLPTLTEEVKTNLDKNVSIVELLDALKNMSSGKAPGPDGIPMERYKKFSGKLLPHLLEMFNESFEKGILSPSWL